MSSGVWASVGKVAIPAVELTVDAFVCVALPDITGVGNVDCIIAVVALDTDNAHTDLTLHSGVCGPHLAYD